VDGVGAISFKSGAALEFHHASKFVSLGARGDVFAYPGFEQAGYASLEVADFGDGSLLLFRRDGGFPAEGEGVDDHRGSLTFRRKNQDHAQSAAGATNSFRVFQLHVSRLQQTQSNAFARVCP
jgi:hypothetical protein